MEGVSLTALDFVVIAVVLISAMFAFVRGFVHEVLSVSGWVGAFLVTFYSFRDFRPFLREHIGVEAVADALTIVVTFVATLVALSFITHAIGRSVRSSSVGALDRSLGFLFGIARGAIIVVVIYMLADWAVPRAEQPEWLRDARVTPYADYGGALARRLMPGSVRQEGVELVEDLGERTFDVLANQMGAEGGDQPDSPNEPGYKNRERKALEFLLRNSGND